MPTIDVPPTTIEELLALPEDGLRHELLRGEHVVTPSPRVIHQVLVEDLAELLKPFARNLPHTRLFSTLVDVHAGPQSLLQPDISVFCLPHGIPTDWKDFPKPILVVEVLSPGTAGRDRGKKREIYQEVGVAEYWIVDIDSRLVERWRPDDARPEILREKITWQPDEDGEVLEIDLLELFGRLPATDG